MKPTDALPFPAMPRPASPPGQPPWRNDGQASRLAQATTHLMAAWLANPRNEMAAEEDVQAMVRLALAIEREARRALEEPVLPDSLPHRPSPQALAWRAGYLDAEAGRRPSFRGPPELEADYRDGRWRALEGRRREER